MGGRELIVAEYPSPTMADIFYGLNLKGRQISIASSEAAKREGEEPKTAASDEVIIDEQAD